MFGIGMHGDTTSIHFGGKQQEVIPVDIQVQATSLYVTQPLGVTGLPTISSKPESIKEHKAAMDLGRWQLLAQVELLPIIKLKKKFYILVQ
jgi:hypothetical protein